MYSAASPVTAADFPPTYAYGLQPIRFGPGQGAASLADLRRRLQDECGSDPLMDDAALEISGTTVAVADGEDLVAALRLHAADTPHLRRELASLLRLERFAGSWPSENIVVGSRLGVLADYRTRPVIDLLMRQAYQLVRDSSVRFALISCAPELHALFAAYGFREYLPPAILPGGTATLRMALVCEYLPDLTASASPLVDLVLQPEIGDSAHAWLAQAFPMLG